MLIRESTIDDVERFDHIRRAVFGWHTASVAAQRRWFETNPPEARNLRLCAEVDGEVVALATCGLNIATKEAGVGSVGVAVDPLYQGRGIAKALYDRIEAHLREIGTLRAVAYARDDERTVAWAQRQGWEKGASTRFSAVDPRSLPPMPAIPADTTIVTLDEIASEVAWELDVAASADEPGDVSFDGLPYDLWLKRVWTYPDLRKDLSQVAVVDGKPVSFTFIEANGERAWSGGTSTLPEYRGRGLAKVLKSIALRKAAEAGITSALTANDYSNGPMLAINDWLGYHVVASEWSMLKKF